MFSGDWIFSRGRFRVPRKSAQTAQVKKNILKFTKTTTYITHVFYYSELPLAPIQTEINNTLISPTSRKILEEIGMNPMTYKSEKLATTLENKKSYILHYR